MKDSFKKASYQELDSLINKLDGTLNEALSKKLNSRVYFLSDKRIVIIPGLVSKILGVIYLNEQEFNKVLNLPDEEGHYLKGFVKNKDDFMEKRQVQVLRLVELLKIEKKQLDFSISSLSIIDVKINNGEIERTSFLDNKYFFPLCVYVGEVIRNEVNGNWSFKTSKGDKNIIEPYIEDTKGKVYSPFLSIYKDFDYSEEEISIESFVKIELMKYEK